ncbi:MAG: hypothetical protein IKF72_14355 [Kiritimatiellae bacterium]|nr:hypothetical protein [Kiritimatiellia bacterium]
MNRGEERMPSPAPGPSADAGRGKGDVPTFGAASSVASGPDDRGESCADVGQSAIDVGQSAMMCIYTDLSVCKALGIRRRVLAEARTAATREADWNAVGEEVGMTGRWVADFAREIGVKFEFDRLEAVTGRYVSVRLVGTTPNKCLVQVELEATKKREFARVRNIMNYPIHYREVFCCERISLPTDVHLEWVAGPNEMKY